MSQLDDAKALDIAQYRVREINRLMDDLLPKLYDPDLPKDQVSNYAFFALGQISSLVAMSDGAIEYKIAHDPNP